MRRSTVLESPLAIVSSWQLTESTWFEHEPADAVAESTTSGGGRVTFSTTPSEGPVPTAFTVRR